jgi:ribosomal protein S18 acetylase RimI-like enzyme
MTLIIREAKLTDITNIYHCGCESLPISYNYFDIMIMILYKKYKIYVVYYLDEFIAYVVCNFNTNDNLHIMSIATYNKYRSKGFGTKLINYISKNTTCKSITLYVHKDNDKGIKFYKKNNFIIKKEIIGYYKGLFKDKSNNAYFMEKILL